jgi:hypothetical protein
VSIHLFKSINGNTPDAAPTAEDLASDLALEMIDRIKERRAIAKAKELACEESEPWQTADKEAYETLEALLKGRHRAIVVKLLLTHFPELVTQMKVN